MGILGLGPAEAKDFAAVRTAYHRRMRAVHPDLNPAPNASEAAARVSAAYDLLDRSYRAQKSARQTRDAAAARSSGTSSSRTNSKARALNDTTVTAMGSQSEVFALARRAGALIGEVSSVDASSGMLVVVAEFLHAAPCQVSLTVVKRGADRAHVRCAVEPLSSGEAPPVAAVTRLVAQKMTEATKIPA